MKRPSFQFYPGDWQANHKLRRCIHEEKGVWIDVLCLLHDSDEYGILHWELLEIARAVGTRIEVMNSLVKKHILKGKPKDTIGSSIGIEPIVSSHLPFGFTPRHGGKKGQEVILIPDQEGPLWFSSRFVIDEYVRKIRGAHGSKSLEHENVPKPKDTIGRSLGGSPTSPSPSPSPSSSKNLKSYMSISDETVESHLPQNNSEPPGWEDCWKIYPRKKSPKLGKKAYQARLTEGLIPDLLLECTKNYVKVMTRLKWEEQHIMLPSTFYGPNERWKDFEQSEDEKDDDYWKRIERLAEEGRG
ncbi:MAG: hypothetical protein V3W19_16420 [Desulfatiglandales bacterium]